MPSKHSRKIYVPNGYYHVYNRGVEKRIIFENQDDYKVFLDYIKEYLSPPSKEHDVKNLSKRSLVRLPNNYNKKIDLLAFCLMPNHFHLLIKQSNNEYLNKFMQSIQSRYSTYFNTKYDRVGPLYQGRYKAILVKNEEYLLHLSRYIHRNPLVIDGSMRNWYSSYNDYIGSTNTPWISKNVILSYFDQSLVKSLTKQDSYKTFSEDNNIHDKRYLRNLTID
ncbi:transposase [Patescibacteria group bacterium]